MTFEWEVEAEAMNHFQNFGSFTGKNLSALERMWVRSSESSQVQKAGSWPMCKTWCLQHMGFDWAWHETNKQKKTQRSWKGVLNCYLIFHGKRYMVFLPSNTWNSLTDHVGAWAIDDAKFFISQDTGIHGRRLPNHGRRLPNPAPLSTCLLVYIRGPPSAFFFIRTKI